MNKQEQEAVSRIKESLEEFSSERYAQHVTADDLKTLLKLIEKNAKK